MSTSTTNMGARTPDAASEAHRNPWASLWQAMIRYDAGKVSPLLALRNAIGVALPLAAGVALGELSGGLVASTGALNVAFSDSQEPYNRRARRMLAASALVGFAVFAGALCGRDGAIVVGAAAIWAFAAGMLVALSPAAADLGAVSLVVLVVFSAFPMSAEKAITSGFLAFTGGLLQTLLAVVFWPLRPYASERRAVGDLYRALAGAAASPIDATEAPPASAESGASHSGLTRPQPLHRGRSLPCASQPGRTHALVPSDAGPSAQPDPARRPGKTQPLRFWTATFTFPRAFLAQLAMRW